MAEFEGIAITSTRPPGSKQHKDILEAVTCRGASGRWGHPAQKPINLFSRLLAIAGTGGVLFDPCAGSGTPGIAAQLYGMKAILIERDERYVDLIKRRLQSSSTTASLTTASS